jgi:glycine oxidase
MQSTDVLVVGAGAAGLGCAVALTRAGLRVGVVDRPPPRASLVAAGMLGPVSEASRESDADTAARVLELGAEGLRAWKAQAPALGVQLRMTGARLAGGAERLQRAARLAVEAGFQAGTGARGELWLPEEAVLDPPQAAAALRAAVQAAGGALRESDETAAPWLEAGRVCGVVLGEQRVRAGAVVLAPGAAVGPEWVALAPALAQLTPARGCILHFAGLPEEAERPVWRGDALYLAPQPGGRLLAGASMELGQSQPVADPAIAAQLHAAAVAARPELAAAAWTAQAGVRALSPAGRPLLGPAAPGLFLAAGMGRNGWLLALHVGAELARAVAA